VGLGNSSLPFYLFYFLCAFYFLFFVLGFGGGFPIQTFGYSKGFSTYSVTGIGGI